MSWWKTLWKNYTAAEREQAELALEARSDTLYNWSQPHMGGESEEVLLNSHGEPSPANPEVVINSPPVVEMVLPVLQNVAQGAPLVAPPLHLMGTMTSGMDGVYASNSSIMLSFSNSIPVLSLNPAFVPPPPTVFDVDYGEMTEPQPPPSPPEPDPPRRRFTFADASISRA
jgi:hypothetical protein